MAASRPIRGCAIIALVLLAAPPVAGAQVAWRVDGGDVRVVCPMTVGGSFEATTSALSGTLTAGDGGLLAGSLAVALDTLDGGIALRTTHMRERYLETGREGFDAAVLSDITLGAGADPRTASGTVAFTARLRLHGVERPVEGEAEISRTAAGVEVTARFPVSIEAHAIPPPRYLGVGVRDEVRVEVRFVAVEEGT
jgi:hypothetical protein